MRIGSDLGRMTTDDDGGDDDGDDCGGGDGGEDDAEDDGSRMSGGFCLAFEVLKRCDL